jgi:hypothetical protein
MLVHGLWCAALALVLTVPCVAGQEEDRKTGSDTLIDQIRRHDARIEQRRVGLLGLRLSHPQFVTGSLGVLWARQPADFDCTTGCDFRGPMVAIEPGLAGAQVGVGYGILVGDKGRNEFFLRRVYIGWGLKATYLRTWGNDSLEPADQSFLGIEAKFTITQIDFRLGAFRSLSRDEVTNPWIVTGGIGWGF